MAGVVNVASRWFIVQENFEKIAKLHWHATFQFIRQAVRDTHIAEDLTQDCFQKAYKGWNQFRGDCSVNTWLRRIAANVVNDFARHKPSQMLRNAAPIDLANADRWAPDRTRSPEATVIFMESVRQIWKIAESAPLKQQTVLFLRFSKDLKVAEIAEVMCISEAAVKVHLFRAVQGIRKALRRRRFRFGL
jgi:RNA polymerase sigma-70 factor (ECF subfamily)